MRVRLRVATGPDTDQLIAAYQLGVAHGERQAEERLAGKLAELERRLADVEDGGRPKLRLSGGRNG